MTESGGQKRNKVEKEDTGRTTPPKMMPCEVVIERMKIDRLRRPLASIDNPVAGPSGTQTTRKPRSKPSDACESAALQKLRATLHAELGYPLSSGPMRRPHTQEVSSTDRVTPLLDSSSSPIEVTIHCQEKNETGTRNRARSNRSMSAGRVNG